MPLTSKSQLWCAHAVMTHMSSTTDLHRCSHVVWSFPESTTATLCSTHCALAQSTTAVRREKCRKIVHQSPRWSHAHPIMKELHWLPVEQHICYKLAVLTFKIGHTSAPPYLSQHIRAHSDTRSLWSLAIPFLDVSFRRTDISKCAASATWNSLPPAVVDCDTLCV